MLTGIGPCLRTPSENVAVSCQIWGPSKGVPVQIIVEIGYAASIFVIDQVPINHLFELFCGQQHCRDALYVYLAVELINCRFKPSEIVFYR